MVDTRIKRGNWDQPDLPCEKHPKASHSTTSNGPKQVLSHCFPVKNFAFRIDNSRVENMICCHTIFSHHQSETASTNMPAYANSRTSTGREPMDWAFLCNSIINFTQCCAGLNPCTTIFYVDIDGSEIHKVDKDEWNICSIRKAFKVMAPTPNGDLQAVFLRTNNDCSDLGFMVRSDYE
ncbi:hypothetical protein Scep_024818 [Stephania cephalantha]|uniref:Uncharacterized protein n=1 Tax=Stephania cephalantha TaxID=152367 RepID=A0AAP0F2M1_9MAGN